MRTGIGITCRRYSCDKTVFMSIYCRRAQASTSYKMKRASLVIFMAHTRNNNHIIIHTYGMKYVLRVEARDGQRSNNLRFIVLSYRAAKVTFDPTYRNGILLYNIKTIMRVVRRCIFCKFRLWP